MITKKELKAKVARVSRMWGADIAFEVSSEKFLGWNNDDFENLNLRHHSKLSFNFFSHSDLSIECE